MIATAKQRDAAVRLLQHAIDHVMVTPDAVFILACAICDVVTDAAENGIILDPLAGATL